MISSRVTGLIIISVSWALFAIISFSTSPVVLTQRVVAPSDSDLYQLIDIAGPRQAPGYYLDAPESQESEDLIDALADGLLAGRQQQLRQDGIDDELISKKQASGEFGDDDDDAARLLEPNIHWPPTGAPESELGGSGLLPPANDPEEFEATLSQLAGVLNRNMPNTNLRQALLMGALASANSSKGSGPESTLAGDSNLVNQLDRGHLIGELSNLVAEQMAANRQHGGSHNDDSTAATEAGANSETSTRFTGSEYMDGPLALMGQHYVQGGAGEGRQLLGPDGTFENVQVIKSDSAIPSYCDPPNPCPIGYTAEDGCLEDFVNLASFSREYQAKQKCSCDNEHSLFKCASPVSSSQDDGQQRQQLSDGLLPKGLRVSQVLPASDSDNTANDDGNSYLSPSHAASDKLDTLARTIQNRFSDLASVQRLIGKQQQQDHERQERQAHFGHSESLALAGNDDEHSDYLVRSARKLSSLDMHHKLELD